MLRYNLLVIFISLNLVWAEESCQPEDLYFSHIKKNVQNGQVFVGTSVAITNNLALTALSCIVEAPDYKDRVNFVFQGWDKNNLGTRVNDEIKKGIARSKMYAKYSHPEINTDDYSYDIAVLVWGNGAVFPMTAKDEQNWWSKEGLEAKIEDLHKMNNLRMAWYEPVENGEPKLVKMDVKFVCKDQDDYDRNTKLCITPANEKDLPTFTPKCGAILYTYDDSKKQEPCFSIYGVHSNNANTYQNKATIYLASFYDKWLRKNDHINDFLHSFGLIKGYKDMFDGDGLDTAWIWKDLNAASGI